LQVETVKEAGYTIRTMAARCGMTAHTLRYYERVGLIQPVGRAQNGHRRYSESDAQWIHFLHCMREANMPIRTMQRYAELRYMGDGTTEERRHMLEEHQQEIGQQIATLQRAFELLTHKIANYKAIEERIRVENPNFDGETNCCCQKAATEEEELLESTLS